MIKQKLFLLFALLLGTFVPHSVLGYSFSAVAPSGQTLCYNITNTSTHTVAVVPQNSSSPYYVTINQPSGILEIPASVTYNGTSYSVTSIGNDAFYGCTGLTSVTIPNSVTGIGYSVFSGCTGLTSVTIPNSVTSIEGSAFQDCTGLIGSLTIPNSVTRIGYKAFQNCTGLTGVLTIPNSVTSIGDYAFQNCTGLTSVTISNQVTIISQYIFKNCTGLTSVTIGNSVTDIRYGAFKGCTGLTTINYNARNCSGTTGFLLDIPGNHWLSGCTALTTVNIGNSVKKIPHCAFYNCTGLTNVTIGNSVTSIGDSAFYGCTGLTDTLTIPNSVTSIGQYAFRGCTGMTSVTIGNSVTSIGNYAFYGCTGLTGSLTIPNSVRSIGNSAFYGCRGLTGTLTIPNSVTSIGQYAFSNCSGLTSVIIPNTVTYIEYSTFSLVNNVVYNGSLSGCPWGGKTCNGYIEDSLIYSDATKTTVTGFVSGLTVANIPNSVTSIENKAFYHCASLTSVTIPNSVTSIGTSAFSGCSGLTGSLTIPNSVTFIGEYAFSGCTGLTSVSIPDSVTYIQRQAFGNCTGLTTINYNAVNCNLTLYGGHWLMGCTALSTVNIGPSVKSIPNDAFYGCTGLTSITIPNTVTSIGGHAFYGCTGLTSVTIPNSVDTISGYAFQNCTGLTTVNYNAVNGGGNGFSYNSHWLSGCSALTTLNIGDSVATIPHWAFYGCTGVTSITIGNSVTSIGKAAFIRCTGLTGTLIIPNSVTAIGRNAFDSCINLQNVILSNNLSRIDTSLFRYCTGLNSITIPNSVTSIGYAAFYGCHGLTSVTIPNLVTSIEDGAFYYCTSLTSINIPNSVTSIGDWAFYGCSELMQVQMHSITPPSIGSISFSYTSSYMVVNIPCYTLSDYRQSWGTDFIFSERTPVFSILLQPNYSERGVVSIQRQNGHNIACDSTAIIVATPNYGYSFSHWENNLLLTDNPRTVSLNQDTQFVAYFQKNVYTLTFQSDNTQWGTVSVDSVSGEYLDTSTQIYANPVPHYHFLRWSDGSTENPRRIVFTEDLLYTAYFAIDTYSVVVQANDIARGTVDGGGDFIYGTPCVVSATPYTGYVFQGWSNGVTANPYTFAAVEDVTLTAIFVVPGEMTHTVTVSVNDAAMGSATANGSTTAVVEDGTTVTLIATPNTGYTFTQWQDGNTDNPRTVTVTADATYTAYFAADQSNAPQIAYVGVDSNGHNAVNWTPQSGTSPVRYNVYREGIQAGVYELVGVVNASGAASYSWTDDQSNPATRAYSYRLAEVAADNTESDLSIPHTTIHLQISQGQGDAWNLAWTPYVGFNYSTYNLYRGTDASSMTLLTTLPATATTYSDLNTGGTAYYYQIEVVQLGGAKTTAVSSRSNIVTTDPDPQTYTLTVLSADVLRGTVTGSGSYTEGTMATLTAEANEGYVFLQWQDGSTANPRNILVTANGTYMAYFTQTEGIADAEGSNVTIIARNGRILVSGAEGRRVMLVDALGRILYCGTATESLTVEAPATGIYLLQVEGHPAHRISVVR